MAPTCSLRMGAGEMYSTTGAGAGGNCWGQRNVLHDRSWRSAHNGRVLGEDVDGLGLDRHVPGGHVERQDLGRPASLDHHLSQLP